MNMSEVEFGEMRLGSFFLKLHFFHKKREEDKRFSAELVRMQTLHLINIQLAVKDKIRTPAELWKFSWEEQGKENEEIDINEATKQLKRLLGLHNRGVGHE